MKCRSTWLINYAENIINTVVPIVELQTRGTIETNPYIILDTRGTQIPDHAHKLFRILSDRYVERLQDVSACFKIFKNHGGVADRKKRSRRRFKIMATSQTTFLTSLWCGRGRLFLLPTHHLESARILWICAGCTR